jgi:recombination protein RecR
MLPSSVQKFIKFFSALPGIGPRQATRLAFYIIRSGQETVYNLAKAIADLKEIKTCPICFYVNSEQCFICNDPMRRKDLVCIIEKETDLISLEKSKKYNGLYLILGEIGKTGLLGIEQKLRIASLKNRTPQLTEIILGINPTAYGDLNVSLILQEIKSFASKITRLGRGLPTGGEIEFADPDTLGGAIDNRS